MQKTCPGRTIKPAGAFCYTGSAAERRIRLQAMTDKILFNILQWIGMPGYKKVKQ